MAHLSDLDLSHLHSRHGFWTHFRRNLITYTIFLGVAFVAVSYSLGYTYNWEARTIQQTGLITIDSRISSLQPEVYLNGHKMDGRFPYRFARLFPGSYDVALRQEGYQGWERHFLLEANKAVTLANVVMVKESPRELSAEEVRGFAVDLEPEQSDVEVRDNELWLRGKFLTRSSEDVFAVRWYPDHRHLAYQTASGIFLMRVDGPPTQRLAVLTAHEAVPFSFRDGGKVLVYEEAGVLRAVELYD